MWFRGQGAIIVRHSALVVTPLLLFTLSASHTASDEGRNVAQPFIEFGSVRLLAGMPRDQVIASLAALYMISPWKNPEGMDTWGVADRNGNHALVGYVTFEAGKLLRAGRNWPQTGSGYDVVHTVSNLLDRFREEGFAKCSASTRKQNRPEGDHDILAINCGSKGITLDASHSRYQGESLTGVDVYEEILYTPSGKR